MNVPSKRPGAPLTDASPTIRVLCVDDHRIVRDGIALIITREADMQVVGLAATGEDAVQIFKRERPNVTLMDLRLGTMTGLEAIRAIRLEDPDARIIVLTMYQGDEDVYGALAAGAATYLLKETLPEDLIRVIRDVHAGNRPLDPAIKAMLAERANHPTLTPREVEVIGLISEGKRNKEIAALLGIAERTVNVHLKNIFGKLNVNDRTAAVQVAVRRGLVQMR
jgi:DNA-binding NarL/FixJ family response regulator